MTSVLKHTALHGLLLRRQPVQLSVNQRSSIHRRMPVVFDEEAILSNKCGRVMRAILERQFSILVQRC